MPSPRRKEKVYRPTTQQPSDMTIETRAPLTVLNKGSWADAVEKNDETLPPLPLTWFKGNDTVKVWQEVEWTTVEHKKKPRRGINNKARGSKRNI